MSDSLQELVDRSAILSAEVQQRFAALIAGSEFDIDFSAAPSLRFAGDEPIEFRPHMIGSSVDRRKDHTWHWGWDNLNDFPPAVVELAERIRAYGAEHDISELTQPELPVESAEAPAALALAAKAITGAWGHYPVNAGGGTTVWVLVDDERLDPGEPQLKPVVKALASAITTADVSDHRTALAAYAELRGLRTAPLPGGGVRLLFADGSADVTFDEDNRVTACQAHQPLEGEAADQFTSAGALTGTATFGRVLVQAIAAEPTAPTAEEAQESPAPEAVETPADTAPPLDEPAEDTSVVETDRTDDPRIGLSPEPARTPAAESGHADEPTAPDESVAPVEPDTVEEEDEEKTAPQPEKKGFFKRLFGR